MGKCGTFHMYVVLYVHVHVRTRGPTGPASPGAPSGPGIPSIPLAPPSPILPGPAGTP